MEIISDPSTLRALYGAPSDIAVKKSLAKLDTHCKAFIGLSPFVLISTSGPDGADISPRGDPPGFVTLADDSTLLIPDRPGNNRIDTLENILRNPAVGLIFLVPGLREALRINGRAEVVAGAELESLALNGRMPKTAIRVRVVEAFFHCAKAIIRGKLWEPDWKIAKSAFPPLGQIIADQIAGVDAESTTTAIEQAYETTLY
jgi:PPOX class probable FMN-dependent enzyme